MSIILAIALGMLICAAALVLAALALGGGVAAGGFFVGQTMKAMQGKANPAVVNELLKKALA